MNLRRCSFLALLFSVAAFAGTNDSASSPRLPFSFVENKGQIDSRFRYIGNGPEFRALFHDNGVVFARGSAHTAVRFAGGAEHPHVNLSAQTTGKTNYLLGSDSHQWITDLPMYDTLRYESVWPGVNIRYSGKDGEAHADYEIDSIDAASHIRLAFDGKPRIEPDGSLVVRTPAGKFRLNKPKLCLPSANGKCELQAEFTLHEDGTVGLVNVAAISAPVDPRILFSGYFGGTSQTTITGVAINSYYNTVVTGWTLATDLPATRGAQTHSGGGIDAFVAAFSPAGGGLIYCTYLGGSGADEASGIAVDASNNTYITGWTSSSNFPVTNPIQTHLSGPRDAFVAKLNAAGNALVYSTYLGGAGVDTGNSITLDTTGAAIILGDSTSANLPTSIGVIQPHLKGSQDAFVAKLTPAGTGIQFLTYFGGSASDHGAAIALDSSGSVFIAGSTYSANLPVFNAAQLQNAGGQDGFLTKMSPGGTAIIFSTYLGGSGGGSGSPEGINAIVIGPLGNPIVAGITSSVNFPIVGAAYQTGFGGGQTDGFICRFNGSTGALQQSTYLGGSGDDGVNALATDLHGYAFATGYTTSNDFPTLNPLQSTNAGGMDAFVVKMTTVMLYATYLGGSGNDCANAIASDSMTSVVIGGSTGSSNYPVAASLGSFAGSSLSAFVTKIAANFTLGVVAAPASYVDAWHNTGSNGPNATLPSTNFGNAGDVPVFGDWDGSGVRRLGVFRNGLWILDMNGNGVIDDADKSVPFGMTGDLPVVGDWNGSGRIKLGLFRQGMFILDLSGHLSGVPSGISDQAFPFGLASDIPVAADWNHSGTTKVGVFRAGQWFVDYNGDQIFNNLDRIYSYGQSGDVPVVGDWNSSGSPKIGVYRHGLWILDYDADNLISGSGQWELYVSFGGSGYYPLVR